MQVLMGVYEYGSEGLRIGVQGIFKDLDNDQEMTVTEVSKKLHYVSQIEETKETLHQTNGGKRNTSELVLDVNSVQADETRVCNNPNCGVTFTPAKPSFYSCNTCHNSGFHSTYSLKLTEDVQKKHNEKQLLKKRAKLAKKGNKRDENEVDTDSDGVDENSDSHEDGNSETS